MRKIGFIGLGIMGRPMAGHLLAGGHSPFAYDIGALPEELLDNGAIPCANGSEIARAADVIINHGSRYAGCGNGPVRSRWLCRGSHSRQDLMDMSSISPIATKEFARRINALGCDYLDAPVSGGDVGAKAASPTIMVGGPERAFNNVKPMLELMSKNITRSTSPQPPRNHWEKCDVWAGAFADQWSVGDTHRR